MKTVLKRAIYINYVALAIVPSWGEYLMLKSESTPLVKSRQSNFGLQLADEAEEDHNGRSLQAKPADILRRHPPEVLARNHGCSPQEGTMARAK